MQYRIRSFAILFVVMALLLGVGMTALAQDAPQMPPLPGEVLVGDLSAPRGLAFDAAGNLLVAVAGGGGETEVSMQGPEGPAVAKLGMTGKVLSIAPDGTVSELIKALPSYALETENLGVYRVIPKGDSIWMVSTNVGPGALWADTVVEYDAKTLNPITYISLAQFEAENNPDGNEIDSNVSDIAWTADGTMLITDAGCNCLLSWTADAGLAVVAAWPENSVPTSVEVAGNGDIYVGFLGAGLAPGAGKIERWSGGALAETFGGLNAVSDILLDGDTLYAVELVKFSDQGPGPGDVVTVTAEGATPVAEGLPAPFAIAKGPDGSLYVTFGTVALGPGMTGGVLKLAGK